MRSHCLAICQARVSLAGLVISLLVPSSGRAQPSIDVVQQWNVIAEDTIVPKAFQNEGLIYMATC